MWIRSSTGYWPTVSLVRASLCGVAVAVGLLGSAPAMAQQEAAPAEDIAKPSFNPGKGYSASTVDPVTLAVLSDALLRLQFLAVAAFESDEDVGLAQSGVVRAYLARRQAAKAVDNADRIADPIWRAMSFIWISDYIAMVEKDIPKATEWVRRAISEVNQLDIPEKKGELLQVAANRLADLGLPDAAQETALEIPEIAIRVSTLQEIAAKMLDRNTASTPPPKVASILREAVSQLQQLDLTDGTHAGVLINIGAVQTEVEDVAAAQATFALAQNAILNGPPDQRHAGLTRLAARMVEAGNQRGGMSIVRLIPEGADRARALAAVSAAMGQRNIDAAVPLFLLADEEAKRVEDQAERFDAITFIVQRQTDVGRLADAFEGAFQITEDVPRAEALLGMGRILLAKGKYTEALVLKDYIPYVGMRAQLMGPVALDRGLEEDPEGASALLAEALDPTGYPYLPRYIPDALDAVLSAQIKGGSESADRAIFARARDVVEVLPGDLAQVHALLKIAIAEARRGRIDDAQKTISAAYRTTFEHREDIGFDLALQAISLAQLAAGDLLGAYDTAARIPEPASTDNLPRTPDGGFDVPRYQALIRVAAAAGRLGDPNFGQEVTDKIGLDPAKAIGLAAVAIAMSNRTSDLIDVIDDIQAGALLSPNFAYLAEPAEGEAPGTEQTQQGYDANSFLGEAAELAPLPPSGKSER